MSHDGVFLNSDARDFVKKVMGQDVAERFPKGSSFFYKPIGALVTVDRINDQFPMNGKGDTETRIVVAPIGAHGGHVFHAKPGSLATPTPAQMQAAMPKGKTPQLG